MKTLSIKISLFALLLCNLVSAQTWSTSGNAGTNSSFNFLGTVDGQKLVFRTVNIPRVTIGTNTGTVNQGVVAIGDIDPDNSPYGGSLQMKGVTNTAIDLIRPFGNATGWQNQIRFYNYNNLRHVIADDYSTGKLVIQTNVDPNSGSVDILDIRGRVQIGQIDPVSFPTPSGYNLYVVNGILTEKVKVALKTTTDWADYVFKKNYKLMSLQDLEKFVLAQNHLPGILSAEQMVKEGNDLAKTDAQLLAKIEELTLYVIQLNKDKQNLDKQIISLKEKLDQQSANDQNVILIQLQQQLAALKKQVEQIKK